MGSEFWGFRVGGLGIGVYRFGFQGIRNLLVRVWDGLGFA